MIRISEFFDVSIEYLFTGKNSGTLHLSKQENELLETYHQLDSRGQHSVHMAIYKELDRMKEDNRHTKIG